MLAVIFHHRDGLSPTLYMLFFNELGSRRIHFAGCTASPETTWVTQQARKMPEKEKIAKLRMIFIEPGQDNTYNYQCLGAIPYSKC